LKQKYGANAMLLLIIFPNAKNKVYYIGKNGANLPMLKLIKLIKLINV